MKYGSLIIEKKEYVYIKRLLNVSGYDHSIVSQMALSNLKHKLEDALIVDEQEMPLDMVRLNSLLTIRSMNNGSTMPLQIVIPMKEEINKQKLSVLSPLGAALLGYSEGDQLPLTFSKNKEEEYLISKVQQDKSAERIDVPI